MRICKLCGLSKAECDFYKGVTSRCKECHKSKVRQNRKDNIEYYRSYDQMRFQRDPWRKEANKRWAASEAGKHLMVIARKSWMDRNPEKRAAHIILGNAVRDGRVEKPKTCSSCGNETKSKNLHGHHHDYSLPLEVQWICVWCHAEEHFPNEFRDMKEKMK